MIGRGRPLGDKGQLEIGDGSVDHGIGSEKGDGFHRRTALGAEERVNFIHLADHLGPALRGNGPELSVHYPLGGQRGQNPRVRQENTRRRSAWQSRQRLRANSQRGLPQSK